MRRYWLILAVFYCFAQLSFAESDEIKVLRKPLKEEIADLVLNLTGELKTDPKSGKQVLSVKGIYFRESWDLEFNGVRVRPDTTGVFYLQIPVEKGLFTGLILARGAGKQFQSENVLVTFPDVTKTEPPKLVVQNTATKNTEAPPIAPKENEAVQAVLDTRTAPSSHFHLASFYVAPLFASQSGVTQRSYSVAVGWSPSFEVSSTVGFRMVLGGMAFEKANGGYFASLEGAALLDTEFWNRLLVSFGGGGQYWLQYGGFKPELTGEIGYKIEASIAGSLKLDRVFAGVNRLFDTLQTTEARLGVSVSF